MSLHDDLRTIEQLYGIFDGTLSMEFTAVTHKHGCD